MLIPNCSRIECFFFSDERDFGKGNERRRYFVRQSNQAGKFGAFNQFFESPIPQKHFRIFREEFRIFTDKIIWSYRLLFEIIRWIDKRF